MVLGPLYGIEIRLVHLSTCDEAGPATSGGGRVERVFHRASRGSRRKERLRACPRPGDGPAFPAPARRIRSSVLAVLFGTKFGTTSPTRGTIHLRFVEPGSCDLLAKSDARIGRKQDAVCDQQTLPSCLACRAAFDSSPNPCAMMKHDAPNQVSNRVVQLTNLDNQGKMASRWRSSASYLRLFYFNPPSTYLRLNYGPQLRVPNSQQS